METTRVTKSVEPRPIDGVRVFVKGMREMSYGGKWEDSGYDIVVDDKVVHNFFGWPTDSDIRRVLLEKNILTPTTKSVD